MTRLNSEMIADIPDTLPEYDRLTPEARGKLGLLRFIHDPLQLGVAVMTVKSLC